MRTIFDKHIDACAKYYSPAKHLAVDEIIVLIKSMGPFQQHMQCDA